MGDAAEEPCRCSIGDISRPPANLSAVVGVAVAYRVPGPNGCVFSSSESAAPATISLCMVERPVAGPAGLNLLVSSAGNFRG